MSGRQHRNQVKSGSQSSFYKPASCKLIGQFNRDVIGCKPQLTNHDGFAPLESEVVE